MVTDLSIFHASSSELVRNHYLGFVFFFPPVNWWGAKELQKSGHPDDKTITQTRNRVNEYFSRYSKNLFTDPIEPCVSTVLYANRN